MADKLMTVEQLLITPPFSNSIPSNPVGRVKAMVREIATGAMAGYWVPSFVVRWEVDHIEWRIDGFPLFNEYINAKWGEDLPNVNLLASAGYLENRLDTEYFLTPIAYGLIEETAQVPVFISYRNSESSAFALLLLARMKMVGLEPFLDVTGLRGGDDWDDILQAKVRESQYVVCLVGHSTLASDYVRKEIQMAHDLDKRIIPIFHNGYNDALLRQAKNDGDSIAAILEERQGLLVQTEKTLDYNTVIIEILNLLGITP